MALQRLACAGALAKLGRPYRARVVLAAVDAVRVGGDGPHVGELDPEREQELGAAPAPAALAADGDRAFAAGDQRRGSLCAPGERSHLARHLARLAGDRVAEDDGLDPLLFEYSGSRLERPEGSGD